MNSTTSKFKNLFILIIPLAILMLSLVWLPSQSGAAPATPPPRNTATPPPGAATATPNPEDEKEDRSAGGGTIVLHITSAPAGAWTAVQWQDSAGNWYDVEGWRGTLDSGENALSGSKVWWVAPKDFGTGPFRWAVYQSAGGALLKVSEAFYLPHEANAIMPVTVQ